MAYTEVLRLRPTLTIALQGRAIAWAQKGNFDQAITDATSVLKIQPNNIVAFENRGMFWSNKRNYDKAIEDFGTAIMLGGGPHAMLLRANAWADKGDLNRALEEFDKAAAVAEQPGAAVDTGAFLIWAQRAVVHYRRREWALAVADSNTALEKSPRFALALYVRGLAELKLGQDSASKADVDAAIAQSPDIAKVFAARTKSRSE